MYREHEADSSEYRRNSREQLCEAHQKSVGEGVGVGDNAADYLARRMRIKVGQRKILDVSERLVADVADNLVGYAVVERVHEPLCGGDYARADADLQEYTSDRDEIDISLVDYEVDDITD